MKNNSSDKKTSHLVGGFFLQARVASAIILVK